MAQKDDPKTTIKHLVDLFRYFQKNVENNQRVLLYRGHGSDEYQLTPSLFRSKEHRKDEKNILRELLSLHPSEFSQDRSMFEQLVRMQHHSLPTRLLDLTYNPLVALYFACKDSPRSDGELITLSVSKRDIRYFDSDTVSCLAGLSNLTGGERDQLRDMDDKNELNSSNAGKRLLQFIRGEKPYFLPEIVPMDLRGIIAVRPKLSNRRIIAQQGAFLLFGLTSRLKDDNSDFIKVSRLDVPRTAKKGLLKELDKINVNDSSLFPEIDHAATLHNVEARPSRRRAQYFLMSSILPCPLLPLCCRPYHSLQAHRFRYREVPVRWPTAE